MRTAGEHDAWRPLGVTFEHERTPEGELLEAMTVFLTGAQCPLSCLYCDLARHTLGSQATPPGALLAQLELALARQAERPTRLEDSIVKLYNASNFFERRAVPKGEDRRLLKRLESARRVVVECHPRLLDARAMAVLAGTKASVEVALGLETAKPEALERMRKQATVADFRAAARRLDEVGAGVRIFLLIGAPFVEPAGQTRWLLRSVELALEMGARVVSLIPLRITTPELRRLVDEGVLTPPTLEHVELAFETVLREFGGSGSVLQLDPWDLAALGASSEAERGRARRLLAMNRHGLVERPDAVTHEDTA